MQLIKGLNQIIYFLLELCMFISFGYAGFQSSQHPVGKYFLGIGLPLLAATLWGIFAAPRSGHRLDMPYRAVFALLLFGLATFALHRTGYPRLAIAFGVTAIVSQLIAVVLKQ